jgi:hypothetical protein
MKNLTLSEMNLIGGGDPTTFSGGEGGGYGGVPAGFCASPNQDGQYRVVMLPGGYSEETLTDFNYRMQVKYGPAQSGPGGNVTYNPKQWP